MPGIPADEVRLVIGVAGAVAAAIAARACLTGLRGRPRSEVAAWALLGAAALVAAPAIAGWAFDEGHSAGLVTAGLLASGILAVAGTAVFPGGPPHLSGRGRTLVDALIVAASALLIAWVAGLDDLYGSAGSGRVVDLAVSLITITGAAGAIVMWTRARPEARPRLALLALGLTCSAVARSGVTYLALGGSTDAVMALCALWVPGWGLVALTAGRPSTGVERETEPGLPTGASVFIPSLPFAAGVVALASVAAGGELDGATIWIGAVAFVLVVARQVLALVENISFWRRLEAQLRARTDELRRSEAHFRSLVQHSSDVIAVLSAAGRITYLSPSAEAVFGYDRDALLSAERLDFLVHDEDLPEIRSVTPRLQSRAGATVSFEVRFRRRDGEWRNVEAVAQNLVEDPAVEGYVVNVRDITERKRGLELSHRAYHDPLTDLANRALLGSRLERALSRARGVRRPVAVLFCDLDDFKRVNDSLGHDLGDAILCAVGDRLMACARPDDTVARLGGDEFAIMLEGEDAVEGAAALAERALAALAPAVEVRGHSVHVQGSIGIATNFSAGVSEASADELLRNADVAMYKAKREGGGRFEFFEPSMHTALMERIRLEERLREAVEHAAFEVHYQPVVQLDGGPMFAVEALVRWPQPSGEVWSPGRFIRVAEETGLIVPLGRWVLNRACEQVAEWARRHPGYPPGPVMVNLSAAQLRDPNLVGDVRAALDRSGLDPSRLVLEITESTIVEGPAMTTAIAALIRLGVRIGIDDFGSEYSSFAYLRKLPASFLKIDGQFMEGVGPGSQASGLVEAIVSVGESMGVTPIAEGVETAAQAEELRRMGCKLAQGFLFGRPGPPEEISALLDQGPSFTRAER